MLSTQKYTEIKTLEKTKSPEKISFAMSNIITTNDVTKIASLMQVTAEQIITHKAEVTHVASVKHIISQHHGQLQKQEIILRDPTGTIKLVLWEQYVNSLVVNHTYVLENLKLKVYNDERYLNTPKDQEFTAKEIEPFQQPLPEAEHVIDPLLIISALAENQSNHIRTQLLFVNVKCLTAILYKF